MPLQGLISNLTFTMKLNIKTLAAVFMMGATLVSCNDQFDESPKPVAYPENFSLGAWTRDYTPENSNSYTVNLTVNEDGDTICDVTTFDPFNTNKLYKANVYEGGKVSYNKATGMITANYETSPEESPARITLTFSADGKYGILNIYELTEGDDGETELKEVEHFNVVPSDTISVLGVWQLSDGTTVELLNDGEANVTDDEGEQAGHFTFSQRSGQITAGGKTYAMSVNDKGQMYITVKGGSPVYAAHTMKPLPNDWTEYAFGTYAAGLFTRPFTDVPLFHSETRGRFRLDPYGFSLVGNLNSTPTPIEFTWNRDTGEIKLKKTTNLNLGQNMVQDGANYGPIRFDLKGDVTVENDVITFPFFYYCDGGSFSEDGETPFTETYTINDYVEQ